MEKMQIFSIFILETLSPGIFFAAAQMLPGKKKRKNAGISGVPR